MLNIDILYWIILVLVNYQQWRTEGGKGNSAHHRPCYGINLI